MACYVPDDTLVVFDTTPPREYVGAAAYRKDFQDFFSNVDGPLDATISDLEVITGGGSVAYSHSIQYVASTDKTGKHTSVTVRVTDAYKRINGQWLVGRGRRLRARGHDRDEARTRLEVTRPQENDPAPKKRQHRERHLAA